MNRIGGNLTIADSGTLFASSVIALAEHFNTGLIVTLDRRHFRAICPFHIEAFRVLPADADRQH